MAGTRSSARQAANSSSPPSTQSNGGTKRKADESSPSTTKAKRGRPSKASKEQKTLEQTMPDAATETKESNGEFQRPQGCWFWLDSATYHASEANGESKAGDAVSDIKEPGDSFKGVTKDGESKEDPEKALKDTRGHAGLNALDQVKASEDDEGTTSKVSQSSFSNVS